MPEGESSAGGLALSAEKRVKTVLKDESKTQYGYKLGSVI